MTTDITTDYSDYSTSSEGETVLDGFSTAANESCSKAACSSRYPHTCTVAGTAPGSPLSQVWYPFFTTNLKLNATWFPPLNVTENNTLCETSSFPCTAVAVAAGACYSSMIGSTITMFKGYSGSNAATDCSRNETWYSDFYIEVDGTQASCASSLCNTASLGELSSDLSVHLSASILLYGYSPASFTTVAGAAFSEALAELLVASGTSPLSLSSIVVTGVSSNIAIRRYLLQQSYVVLFFAVQTTFGGSGDVDILLLTSLTGPTALTVFRAAGLDSLTDAIVLSRPTLSVGPSPPAAYLPSPPAPSSVSSSAWKPLYTEIIAIGVPGICIIACCVFCCTRASRERALENKSGTPETVEGGHTGDTRPHLASLRPSHPVTTNPLRASSVTRSVSLLATAGDPSRSNSVLAATAELDAAMFKELNNILAIASTRKESDIVDAAVRACKTYEKRGDSIAMERLIWSAGGGAALVTVLKAHGPTSKLLARAACCALQAISYLDEHKRYARGLGAVQAIQMVMESHPDPVTQIDAKHCLKKLDECVKAPEAVTQRPATWREARTADGRVYFVNDETRETSWTRP